MKNTAWCITLSKFDFYHWKQLQISLTRRDWEFWTAKHKCANFWTVKHKCTRNLKNFNWMNENAVCEHTLTQSLTVKTTRLVTRYRLETVLQQSWCQSFGHLQSHGCVIFTGDQIVSLKHRCHNSLEICKYLYLLTKQVTLKKSIYLSTVFIHLLKFNISANIQWDFPVFGKCLNACICSVPSLFKQLRDSFRGKQSKRLKLFLPNQKWEMRETKPMKGIHTVKRKKKELCMLPALSYWEADTMGKQKQTKTQQQ